MSKKKQRQPAARSGRIALIATVVLLAVFAVFFVARNLSNSDKPASFTKDDPGRAQEKLIGRWQRPDGGYVLEIRNAEANGELDVSYYNPRSINIGSARWWREDGVFKVFVELRDTNYPGSTYTLDYLPVQDRLAGDYFQAVQKATFAVEFARLN